MALRLPILLAALLAGAGLLLVQSVPAPTLAAGDTASAGMISRSSSPVSMPLQATAVTTTTLKAIPSPSVLTETVWLEAMVTDSLDAFSPTGTISLYGDGTPLGAQTISIDNWVRLELPPLATGTHIFTATYSGDSTFAPSSSAPLPHIVRRSGVRLGISYAQGLQVAFSFEVIPESGAPPDGSVTVSDGVSSCTAAASAGSCTILFPSAGPRRLTATYSGSAMLESNVSAPLDYIVQRFPVEIRARMTPDWIDAGQPLTVTYAVVKVDCCIIPQWPSGPVTVRVGDTELACSPGICTFIPGGRVPIRIDYSGDDYFAPSSITLFAPVRFTTGISIRATPNPVGASQVMTLTASLGSNGSGCVASIFGCPPTGHVDYYDNGAYLGSAIIHPRIGFVFPLAVRLRTVGTHIITGNYDGDTRYAPSTSAPLTVQVVAQPQYLPVVRGS